MEANTADFNRGRAWLEIPAQKVRISQRKRAGWGAPLWIRYVSDPSAWALQPSLSALLRGSTDCATIREKQSYSPPGP